MEVGRSSTYSFSSSFSTKSAKDVQCSYLLARPPGYLARSRMPSNAGVRALSSMPLGPTVVQELGYASAEPTLTPLPVRPSGRVARNAVAEPPLSEPPFPPCPGLEFRIAIAEPSLSSPPHLCKQPRGRRFPASLVHSDPDDQPVEDPEVHVADQSSPELVLRLKVGTPLPLALPLGQLLA